MGASVEKRPSFGEVRRPASAYSANEMKLSAIQERLRKPQDFKAEWWEQSMGVLHLIQRMGAIPQEVITDSPVGKDVPSKYSIGDAQIRFMPQWRYVTIENKGRSTMVPISPVRTEQDRHAQEWRRGQEKVASEKDNQQQWTMRKVLEIQDLGLRIEDIIFGLPQK